MERNCEGKRTAETRAQKNRRRGSKLPSPSACIGDTVARRARPEKSCSLYPKIERGPIRRSNVFAVILGLSGV